MSIFADGVHPSTDELRAYGTGRLDANQHAEVEQHIAECETCCQIVAAVLEDTLQLKLRQAAGESASSATGDSDLAARPSERDVTVPPELEDHPRYEIVRVLGVGGMGVVYEAVHRLMARRVALKVIHRELVSKPAAVERFRQEVKAAAQLVHPNIVTAHDAEQAGDVHFLVMECIDGISLARLVKDCGPLPVAEACDYVRQSALGLQHAFERGMVHRDINPQNLMVTREAGCGAHSEISDVGGSLDASSSDATDPTSHPKDHGARSMQPAPHAPHCVKILDFGLTRFARGRDAGNRPCSGERRKCGGVRSIHWQRGAGDARLHCSRANQGFQPC